MVDKRYFGKAQSGEDVYIFDLSDSDICVSVMQLGAAIVNIFTPDRDGVHADIVCGYDSLESYENGDGYLGAVVGRWANRICDGAFTLVGKKYSLYCNDKGNHLHGGKQGFSHKVWDATVTGESSVRFSYTSPDGEEGYPGELCVSVEYILYKGRLTLRYRAQSDKDTVINLTNHAYFNLAGCNSGKIFDHELYIAAHSYLPAREGLIPTGEIKSVEGTPFDFRQPKTIGRDFDLLFPDLAIARGYDHCMVLERVGENKPNMIAYDKKSGRGMRVYTTQPCVQLYTANYLTNEDFPLKGGYPQSAQSAFCLETQIMPDSMNHVGFTDPVLKAGDEFFSETSFEFFAD